MIPVKKQIRKGVAVYITPTGQVINQGKRKIKSGNEFNHLIDVSKVKNYTTAQEGGVEEIVKEMQRIVKGHYSELSKLANYLKADTQNQTLINIWEFVFNHLQYRRDKLAVEQLTTPARIWANRHKQGEPSDCDDHTIFVSSLLCCLGIDHKIRIAGYDNKPFSHVYTVVENTVLDTVLYGFNFEAEYSSKKDYKMKIETLHGLEGVEGLSGLGELQELENEFEAKVNGFSGLDGLGELEDDQAEKLINDLVLRNIEISLAKYESNPEEFHKLGFDPFYWIKMRKVYNALKNYSVQGLGSLDGITVAINEAVEHEKKLEEKLNSLDGLEALEDYTQEDSSNDIYDSINEIDGLGSVEGFPRIMRRLKARRNAARLKNKRLKGAVKIRENQNCRISPMRRRFRFFRGLEGFRSWWRRKRKKLKKWAKKTVKKVGRGIKKAAKWTGKALKKVGKAIVRYNPITAAIRLGFRAVIGKNMFNSALKFGWGLLSISQAKKLGIDLKEHAKSVRAWRKVAKKYTRLGGKESKLRKVLAKAWIKAAKKKNYPTLSYNEIKGLGVVVTAAATGTGVASALAFLKPVLKWLKDNLNVKKIVKSVKEKGIARVKEKLEKATDPAQIEKYAKKLAKKELNLKKWTDKIKKSKTKNSKAKNSSSLTTKSASSTTAKPENNVLIYNKEASKTQAKNPVSNDPNLPNQQITNESKNTASMNILGIAAMGLVALGMIVEGSKSKQKTNSKTNSKTKTNG